MRTVRGGNLLIGWAIWFSTRALVALGAVGAATALLL